MEADLAPFANGVIHCDLGAEEQSALESVTRADGLDVKAYYTFHYTSAGATVRRSKPCSESYLSLSLSRSLRVRC